MSKVFSAHAVSGDGAGRSFFQELPEHAKLRLLQAVPAPCVTRLPYEAAR